MRPIESKFVRRNQRALRSTRAAYHLLVHTGNEGFIANPNMTSIEVDRGCLWVNGIPINAPKFTPDHISWRQHTDHGYSAGCIYLYEDGLSVHGAISQGQTALTTSGFDVVGTAIKPITYKTRISKSPFPAGTDPSNIADSDFIDGLALVIGYETRIGESTPRPTVSLGGQDITTKATWLVDEKGRTVLKFNLDDTFCLLAPELYRTAQIGFDPLDFKARGAGMVQATCQSASPAGTALVWTAVPQPATAQFVVARRVAAVTELVTAEDKLEVNELITLLPDDQVNEDANSMLMRNMKWAMGQDETERGWLAEFFGQTPPSGIPDDQQQLIRKSLEWYQQKFAKGYLTQAFNTYSGPNEPSTRLDKDQAARLDNFLRNGLAQSTDFNVQHQGIYVDAYVGAKPRLASYLADAKKNGTNWAQKVFDQLTGGPQFILIVNRVAGAAGDKAAMGPVNNFACLLTALDPSGKTAKAYYESVLSGVIVNLVPQTNQGDKETIMQWLPTAMQEFLRQLADGKIPGQTDISQTEGKEMYQFYLQHTQEVTASMADLLQSITAMNLVDRAKKLEEGFDTIADKYPKLAKAGRFMFVIGWIGGVASIITALVKGDWKKMSEIEKAQFVTGCVQAALQAFQAVPEIFNGIKSISISVWNRVTVSVQAPENQTATRTVSEELSGKDDFVYVAAENSNGLIGGGAVAARGSLYARVFGEGIVAGIVKILGAAAAVAMAGYSLWQLINDVKTHGSVSTIVFDSIVFATTFLSAVCLVVDLFVATTFLPVVGAILAIVGLIASFIAQFVDKPKNPVEEWMKAYGIDFAKALPAAPESAFA